MRVRDDSQVTVSALELLDQAQATQRALEHQVRILSAALRDIRDNRAYSSASDCRLSAGRALLMASHYAESGENQ